MLSVSLPLSPNFTTAESHRIPQLINQPDNQPVPATSLFRHCEFGVVGKGLLAASITFSASFRDSTNSCSPLFPLIQFIIIFIIVIGIRSRALNKQASVNTKARNSPAFGLDLRSLLRAGRKPSQSRDCFYCCCLVAVSQSVVLTNYSL